MKTYKISFALLIIFSLFSCSEELEKINIDPNKISETSGEALFNGMILANTAVQAGYLNFSSNVVSGYFVGDGRLSFIQEYQYPNTDSDTPWRNIYVGVVKQSRILRSGIPVANKDFFYGASKVIEAHAIGTAASIFGDVPYTEAANLEGTPPGYDNQIEIYNNLQSLLDEAILDLQNAKTTGGVNQDSYFNGNANSWIKTAYTLKARLFLENRDYSNAIAAAQNGISRASESMKFRGTNLLNELKVSSTFSPDATVQNSYLIKLIGSGTSSRNNIKTNEVDRAAYYYNGNVINLNGIAAANAPTSLITLEENLLTWAEALIRSNSSNFNTALARLNEHRANLRNGVYFPVSASVYDNYVEADFLAGGIENFDGALSKEDALLREIIEERYASFFVQIIAFNDLRRTKKDPISIQVAIPFNTGTQHPERFLYPFDELNTNGENVPNVTDIFVKTQVNQ
ncbi:SusD/RagB family nutrient-binding outer membrane lipoprotein [Polaribacter batillariae]|uniref:SusD/RagB family nutrient-binding outer membrane lipoprotein n=1 Tax=Polaribacter batillariae TaxID=2808900 RepID=A0ABX7SW43_9FLAO|nr:SusD/RagB family nutrient-binding outer membrane lipoprotein [Polaribacter batillariae]QTD37879.1 SusD/RagB family nutrient-binding outer membrane lipoprotein [Polaribacter batillariae]